MLIQSRSSLLDLPLEIRQHILGYIFEDALQKDNRFNNLIREPRLTEYYTRDRSTGRGSAPTILALLGAFRADADNVFLYSLFGATGATFDAANVHAPSIFQTATLIASTNDQLAGDMIYVLSQTLDSLERMQETEMNRTKFKGSELRRQESVWVAWMDWWFC
ncbi:hypothetical protein FKW77_004503 [Venturia effusa]|uniref:Uncharacterized protein n=1 Tax=Venturia effusa TaxID=50376 RepID=A0A517LLC6_9PEZI|nr:hypothetical protein FKW77_004503 [Venturia effusa]